MRFRSVNPKTFMAFFSKAFDSLGYARLGFGGIVRVAEAIDSVYESECYAVKIKRRLGHEFWLALGSNAVYENSEYSMAAGFTVSDVNDYIYTNIVAVSDLSKLMFCIGRGIYNLITGFNVARETSKRYHGESISRLISDLEYAEEVLGFEYDRISIDYVSNYGVYYGILYVSVYVGGRMKDIDRYSFEGSVRIPLVEEGFTTRKFEALKEALDRDCEEVEDLEGVLLCNFKNLESFKEHVDEAMDYIEALKL